MQKNKRAFLIVMDSFGVGHGPDAAEYGDAGANTLKSVMSAGIPLPNFKNLGLFNIDEVEGDKAENPVASYGRLQEVSKGKDTTIGHWEIAGIISEQPLPVFPDGFPTSFITQFEIAIGRKTLCNKPYSGTQVIDDFGKEHLETGAVIVYTSADSVFQIAAHEEIVPIEELYRICEIARERLTGDLGVGRVIARPFYGEMGDFHRSAKRHDYSLLPPQKSMLVEIEENGGQVIGVGKISDIFAAQGITRSMKTDCNATGIQKTLDLLEESFEGLAFVNLVDFDMSYGHRNDIEGYAKAMLELDNALPLIMEKMTENDLLILTADHGCDPGYPGSDHTRECTPLLVYNPKAKGENLGTQTGFYQIAKIVKDWLL